METLKPLNQIIEIDDRHKLHGYALADRHRQVAALELPRGIPETIASAFAVARNLWLYGWFYWPLCTLASFEAWRCIEMALKMRWRIEGSPPLSRNPKRKDKPSFRELFRFACEKKWLANIDFAAFLRSLPARKYMQSLGIPLSKELDSYVMILEEIMPRLRNSHAHPDGLTIIAPEQALGELETARDVIQKLLANGSPVVSPTVP